MGFSGAIFDHVFDKVIFDKVIFDKVIFDKVIFDKVIFEKVIFDKVIGIWRYDLIPFLTMRHSMFWPPFHLSQNYNWLQSWKSPILGL